MNKQQLLTLISVNLRYANPQVTDKARKKGKSGSTLTRYLVQQYLLSGLIFLVIYGLTMAALDFSRLPGFFTYYVALFGVLGLSQGISAIFNVFFESQDLPAYLPLPFRQMEIFTAKIFVVFLTVAPFVFPLFVLFLLTGIRAQLFLLLTVVLAIVLFILFLVIVFSVCSLIVFGLARTKLFRQHKKLMTSLLLGVSTLVVVVGILMMNQSTSYDTEVLDRVAIPFLLPFYSIMTSPLTFTGGWSFGLILFICLALLAIIRFFILPKFYEQISAVIPSQGNVRRKRKSGQGLSQLLFNYNSQLVRDPNLIMQVLSTSLMTPLIFIVTFALSGRFSLEQLDTRFCGVLLVAGLALSVMMVNPTSFISTLISLDQQNFQFVRSLPLSMKSYLQTKFRFGLLLQAILNSVIALVVIFLFKMPIILAIAFFVGNLLGCYLLCLKYFARDYRLLLLDWTNISQLFARGSGSVGLVLGMVGTLFISVILLIGYWFAAMTLPFWLINGPVFAVLVGGSFLWYFYYQRKFWRVIQ
jgi:ABC-2 type transport system permease protein